MIKNEYGFNIYDYGATADMYFSWDDYTIAINELTYDYINNFMTPVVLQDLDALLKQTEENYNDLL